MLKYTKMMGRAFLLALLIAASQNTKADVANGSFENGFTGWTTGPGLYLMDPIYWTPSQGTNVLEIGGANTSGSYISQTVSVDGGWSYSLSFDYANIGNPGLVSSLAVTVSTTNGVLVSNTFNLATHTLTFGTYIPETLNFSVPQGVGSVTITFADQSANNGIAVDPLLDNVGLTATGHEFLNGSFEQGTNAWTIGPGLYLMDPIYWTPSQGTNVLEIGGADVPGSYVSQTFLVTAGNTYDLTFDYSCIGDPYLVSSLAVSVSTPGGDLASDTYNLDTHTLDFGTYIPETLTFTVPTGVTSVTVTFADQSANDGIAVDPLVDNVAVTQE